MGPALGHAVYDCPVAVIGDVHGNSVLLKQLLARLPADMPILFVGDLCDRGPDTRGVYELLIARKASGVRGNHDEWFDQWVSGGGFDGYALNSAMGGRATLQSYGVTGRYPGEIEAQRLLVPASHRLLVASLPIALDLVVMGQKYWLIHAGVGLSEPLGGLRPEEVVPHLARHSPDSLLWPHTRPGDVLPLDRPVIMGHICLRAPVDAGSAIGIDTGCSTVPAGKLSAVILPERRFVTVGEMG